VDRISHPLCGKLPLVWIPSQDSGKIFRVR
jgi:hypothetical protein